MRGDKSAQLIFRHPVLLERFDTGVLRGVARAQRHIGCYEFFLGNYIPGLSTSPVTASASAAPHD
jgi:hypothetical protein